VKVVPKEKLLRTLDQLVQAHPPRNPKPVHQLKQKIKNSSELDPAELIEKLVQAGYTLTTITRTLQHAEILDDPAKYRQDIHRAYLKILARKQRDQQ